jgi:hypothetical protein
MMWRILFIFKFERYLTDEKI